jgi:hypothetical protein
VTDAGVKSLFGQLPNLRRFRLHACAKVSGDVLKPPCERAAAVNKANKELTKSKSTQPLGVPSVLTHLELSHQPKLSGASHLKANPCLRGSPSLPPPWLRGSPSLPPPPAPVCFCG